MGCRGSSIKTRIETSTGFVVGGSYIGGCRGSSIKTRIETKFSISSRRRDVQNSCRGSSIKTRIETPVIVDNIELNDPVAEVVPLKQGLKHSIPNTVQPICNRLQR